MSFFSTQRHQVTAVGGGIFSYTEQFKTSAAVVSVIGAALSKRESEREREAVRKCWEISSTLKQPQNHSLLILPPVNVRYYCLFHFDTLLPNPQGAPVWLLLPHSSVKWLISKAEVSCTEGQMYRLPELYLLCHTDKEWRLEINTVHQEFKI